LHGQKKNSFIFINKLSKNIGGNFTTKNVSNYTTLVAVRGGGKDRDSAMI